MGGGNGAGAYGYGCSNAVNFKALGDVPLILLKKGHAIRRETYRMFPRNHINPCAVMETASNINAVQLADSGLGAAIVLERAVEVMGGRDKIHYYSLGNPISTWYVNVVYLKDAYLDGAE